MTEQPTGAPQGAEQQGAPERIEMPVEAWLGEGDGYLFERLAETDTRYVRADLHDEALAALREIAKERDTLRAAMVELFAAEDGFTEGFDTLVGKGLLTEVPADEDFRDEWDADTMFVWSWSVVSSPEQLAARDFLARATSGERTTNTEGDHDRR